MQLKGCLYQLLVCTLYFAFIIFRLHTLVFYLFNLVVNPQRILKYFCLCFHRAQQSALYELLLNLAIGGEILTELNLCIWQKHEE